MWYIMVFNGNTNGNSIQYDKEGGFATYNSADEPFALDDKSNIAVMGWTTDILPKLSVFSH